MPRRAALTPRGARAGGARQLGVSEEPARGHVLALPHLRRRPGGRLQRRGAAAGVQAVPRLLRGARHVGPHHQPLQGLRLCRLPARAPAPARALPRPASPAAPHACLTSQLMLRPRAAPVRTAPVALRSAGSREHGPPVHACAPATCALRCAAPAPVRRRRGGPRAPRGRIAQRLMEPCLKCSPAAADPWHEG